MELGNMIFGNSRGEVPVDRSLQDVFCTFLEMLGYDNYGHLEYGRSEHPDFAVRPYFWGDCECGWEEIECPLGHRAECYDTRLQTLRQKHGTFEHGYWYVPYDHTGYKADRDALCDEMGLDKQYGCECHCTCDFGERYNQWFDANKLGAHGHTDDCPIVLPNFEHRPSGFSMKWYKYPLRDSYANAELTKSMIHKWIRSLPSQDAVDE